MGIMRFFPPSIRAKYMEKRGIPFTKGYNPLYDEKYREKAKDYARYQAVNKNKFCVETDIEQKKGLAVKTKEREQELINIFKKNKFSFHEPGIFLNPYGMSPLCAYVFFYTEQECSVRFTVEGKTKEVCISEQLKVPCKWHRVPVYGLYPGQMNTVYLELIDLSGKVTEKNIVEIKTKPLPEWMDDSVRVEKKKAASSMKLIFVAGKSTPFPIAFDENGDIRYVMAYRPRGYGFFELANGRFIIMERQTLLPTYLIPHSTQMYEIDYLGRVYRTYYVPNGIHHDVCEMTPGGNLLIASNSQCGHVEDCVAEVNRHNGRIEKFLDMREILKTAYRDRTNWVHVNSIEYFPDTKNVVISARNIHSIICVNWKTNKLKWILGEKNFWKKTPLAHKLLHTPDGMPWHFQQHSVKAAWDIPKGKEGEIHLAVFDNHWDNRRKIDAFDQDELSYVTVYAIDEKERTVKLEKRFGSIKSKITSNGVIKYSDKRAFYMGGFLAYPEQHDNRCASISEFDYDSGEELNRYSLRYFFFRAFEMKPDMADLASAMDFYERPCVGYLQPFDKMTKTMEVPKQMIENAPLTCQEERVRFRMEDDNLQIKTRDHLIEQVFLVGQNISYVKDFREPQREQDLAADMEYYVSMPLYNIEFGSYKLVVQFKGVCYNTGKTVCIQTNE